MLLLSEEPECLARVVGLFHGVDEPGVILRSKEDGIDVVAEYRVRAEVVACGPEAVEVFRVEGDESVDAVDGVDVEVPLASE